MELLREKKKYLPDHFVLNLINQSLLQSTTGYRPTKARAKYPKQLQINKYVYGG